MCLPFNRSVVSVLVGLLVWSSAGAIEIVLDPETEHQTIVGFGGNDPRDQVNQLVNDLGLSAHRDWINCDANGTSGAGWGRLRELKEAGVRVFIASPWSPPAHMKWNSNCTGTDLMWNKLSNGEGPYNDYLHPDAHPEKGGKRNYYPDFAQVLVTYAQNFEREVGTNLTAISPQNEPAFAQPYTSCVYYLNGQNRVNQLRDIVWEMGQALDAANLSRIKIFVAEDMLSSFVSSPYVQLMMADEDVAPYVDAMAVHGYSDGINPSATTEMASMWGGRRGVGSFAQAKGIDCWMTETSGYVGWSGGEGPEGYTDAGAQELGVAIHSALKHGNLSGWWWWRLAVTQSYWTDETLIYNGVPNKNYYVSKNYYKYIRPGAVMIEADDSADSLVGVTAFHHKENNTLTLVIVNSSASSREITLAANDLPADGFKRYVTTESRNFDADSDVTGNTLTVPANSFTTLYGTSYNPSTSVFDHLENGKFTTSALRRHTVARIYTLNGKLVRTIVSPRLIKGALAWDGCDAKGNRLPFGSYHAVMRDAAGTTVHTRIALVQ